MRHILRRRFRKLADAVREPFLNFFFDPVFNAEERRAEAERVLRAQLDEWATEKDSNEQGSGFNYARGAGFDPKP